MLKILRIKLPTWTTIKVIKIRILKIYGQKLENMCRSDDSIAIKILASKFLVVNHVARQKSVTTGPMLGPLDPSKFFGHIFSQIIIR